MCKIEKSKVCLQVFEFVFSRGETPRLPANCEHLIQLILRDSSMDNDEYDVTTSTISECEGR